MKNKKLTILVILLLALALVAVGYAAISSTQLYIKGNASGTASQTSFLVKFTGTPTITSTRASATVAATITDDLNATIDVSGLTAEGDTATAVYDITNASTGITANLSATSIVSNSEYFEVTQTLADSSIAAGASTKITVVVKLIKTPVTEDVSSTVTTTITATPVQN